MAEIVQSTKKTAAKAYKEHKPFLEKYVTSQLPKVYKVTNYTAVIPGYVYINHGIQYLMNEPIDPCTDYRVPVTELEEEDLEPIFKQDFKRRGEIGITMRIQQVKAMHELQKKQFPNAFKD